MHHTCTFADDTAVVGLISKGDKSAYSEEVQRLMGWCTDNNLTLNIKKTKDLINFRRKKDVHTPLYINEERLENIICPFKIYTTRFINSFYPKAITILTSKL